MSLSIRFGVVVGLVISGALVGCSGESAEIEGATTAQQEQGLKAGECVSESINACLPAAMVSAAADASCKAKGLDLEKLAPGKSCGAGTEIDSASWQCCKTGPTPTTPPTPGTPACFGDSAGGPAVCRAATDFKTSAEAACKAKGLDLVLFDVADACGNKGDDTFRYAKFECCTGKPPAPPTPAPTMKCQSDVYSTKTCEPSASLEANIAKLCAASGLPIVNLVSPYDMCSKDAYYSAKYECCAK